MELQIWISWVKCVIYDDTPFECIMSALLKVYGYQDTEN